MKKYNGFTLLAKHFRSDSSQVKLTQPTAQSSQTKFRCAHSYGFTLAETLIVFTVLGIIAVLTVPNLVNKNKVSVNKTRVKKAMAAYESALNKMVIENGVKNDNALMNWANQNPNCENTSSYFKIAEGNGCVFKTTDGIWWDISDIQRPLIAFRQEDLTSTKANDANDMTAFVMVGRFDDNNSLRIDDLLYETNNSVKDAGNNESSAQVAKLYGFMNAKGNNAGGADENNENGGCNQYDALCLNKQGAYDNYPECSGEYRSCYVTRYDTQKFYYNENGVAFAEIGPNTNRFIIEDGSNREVWVELDDQGRAYVIQTRISGEGIDGNCCDNERTRVEFSDGKPYHLEVFNGNTGEVMDVYYDSNGNITSCYGSWMSCDDVKNEAYSRLESYGYGVNNSVYPMEW